MLVSYRALSFPDESSYVFSAFFWLSDANDLFKVSNAVSVLVVTGEVAGLLAVAVGLLAPGTHVLLFVVNFFGMNKPTNAGLSLLSTFTIPFLGLGCNDFSDDDMVVDSKVFSVVR